jgi:hypothetical protein
MRIDVREADSANELRMARRELCSVLKGWGA